ncbi:MAG: sodium/solute symporter [Planctomycetes bacterium]|nr:sodium/solute symporter [Planctomycetota bacterium]
MAISPLDLSVLGVYLAATVAFGVWMGRGQKSASDYLLGGRNLPWWLLLLSIVATETSTATFLSVPGIAYGGQFGTGDLRYLQLPIGYIVGRSIAALVLLPLYFHGQLFTAYDVLRERSGPAVRTLASGLFLVTRTLADGLRLYLAALVMQIMFDCTLTTAVLAVGAATVVYTVTGGIKAVVWTDAIQFTVYMLGAGFALWVLGDQLEGGLGGMLDAADETGRLRVFDWASPFGDDPAAFWSSTYTFWAGLIGGAVLSIGSHGVDQIIVQRYLSARSLRDARKALLWSGPVVMLQFAFFLVLGLGLAAFYAAHPPSTPFQKGDRVFADFIVHHLPTGLVGVVLGAVFSAAMSTLSSSLSASASALVNDFVLPLTGHRQDSKFALRAARAATVVFAALQIGVGISGLGGADAVVNQVLGIASVTTGVILGLFLLALLPKRSNLASLVGLCAGAAAAIVVVFVLKRFDVAIAWPWHSLLTCGPTVLVGGLLAMLLGQRAPREAAA